MLTIADLTDGDKFDKFVAGLKKQVRIAVMKSTVATFEQAAQVAFRVDGVLWSSHVMNRENYSSNDKQTSSVDPMEIGNVEGSSIGASRDERQGKKERDNNACFVCHTSGCRPWKHRKGQVNNFNAVEDEEEQRGVVLSDDSDPEN